MGACLWASVQHSRLQASSQGLLIHTSGGDSKRKPLCRSVISLWNPQRCVEVAFQQYGYQLHSHSAHCATMLRTAFPGYAILLSALFASAIAGQLNFEPENTVTDIAQIPLSHHDSYRLVCHGISRSISPASQVFYPGAVFPFLSGPLPIAYVGSQILPNSRKIWLIG